MKYLTLTDYLENPYPVELPDGWMPIFHEMCESLNTTLTAHGATSDSITFLQIKEKFGEMRVYCSFDGNLGDELTSICSDIINAARSKSIDTCCECGNFATYVSTGWICPYCLDCAEQDAAKKGVPLEKHFKKISR